MLPASPDHESNVTLESERSGVIEDVPFRILVIGDWSGDGSIGLPARPIEIDRDNFSDVMGRFGVSLDLDVRDTSLRITFESIDDFHPDRLFERLDEFSELRELRVSLLDSDSYEQAAARVRAWSAGLQGVVDSEQDAVPAMSESGTADLLDAILSGGKNTAAARGAEPASPVSELVRELVRPHILRIDEGEQTELLAAVDLAISDLMREILHDRRFQALEASWRGLYFLVRRADTNSELKISVIDTSKEELLGDLRSVNDLRDSALHRALAADDVEWAVLAGNYAFQPTSNDVAGLIRLSRIAESFDAPFISHMRPEVIGVHSLAGHTEAREWSLSTDSDEGKLWAALRGLPESRYLGLAIPRFLARVPYGIESDALETFEFEEFTGQPEHDDYVWANPAFAVTLLLAQSFSNSGWDLGTAFAQDLENMPIHIYKHNEDTIYQPCAEVQLTQDACEKLMEFGLIPLISYKNSDLVKVGRFQSITDPVTGLQGKWGR